MRIIKGAARPPGKLIGFRMLRVAAVLVAAAFILVPATAQADSFDFGETVESQSDSSKLIGPVYGFIHVTPDGEERPVLMLRLDKDIRDLAWFLGVRMQEYAMYFGAGDLLDLGRVAIMIWARPPDLGRVAIFFGLAMEQVEPATALLIWVRPPEEELALHMILARPPKEELALHMIMARPPEEEAQLALHMILARPPETGIILV